MFTIKRSGALALCMTALLVQNAQIQAFSFASVYNALKNNPGKTVAAVLSGAVAGYGLYKWLSPPPAKRTIDDGLHVESDNKYKRLLDDLIASDKNVNEKK